MRGSSFVRMEAMADYWLKMFVFMVVVVLNVRVHGSSPASITLLHSAVQKGAVCLDGSPPAYFYDKGIGEGANNWIVHLEGGGWCKDEQDCINRSHDKLGSSSKLDNQTFLGGILTNVHAINPDFYNWNRVWVRYCDGASFSGDVEEVNPKNNIHRRGARIFKAVIEDLMEKGLKNAKNAILSGNSAGGLATLLQCDNFRAYIPNVPKVKCVADSGFFIHAQNLPGAATKREQPFAKVIAFHGLNKALPKACTSKMDVNLCLFPENFIGDIQTPLFLVNSAFDEFQLNYRVVIEEPAAGWDQCKTNGIKSCSPAQVKTIKDFHSTFLQNLPKRDCPSLGLFIDACFVHDHLYYDERWNGSPTVNNKTIAKVVGDWFFDRSCSHEIDVKNDFPYQCKK